MKVAHIVLTVAPRPRVPIDKMFTIAQLIEVHLDLYGSFRGHECEIRLYLLDGAR